MSRRRGQGGFGSLTRERWRIRARITGGVVGADRARALACAGPASLQSSRTGIGRPFATTRQGRVIVQTDLMAALRHISIKQMAVLTLATAVTAFGAVSVARADGGAPGALS